MSKKLPSGILVKADLTKDLERRKKQSYINEVSHMHGYNTNLVITEKCIYASTEKIYIFLNKNVTGFFQHRSRYEMVFVQRHRLTDR